MVYHTLSFYDPFLTSFFTWTLRPVTRGRRGSKTPWKISPPGKMCWTEFITIGYCLKNLGPSQKTLYPPTVPSWFRASAPLMDSLVVNKTCKCPITKLKRHFCLWRNHTYAHNPWKSNCTVIKPVDVFSIKTSRKWNFYILEYLEKQIYKYIFPLYPNLKCNQAPNQLGKIRGAKIFLRGAQSFDTMFNTFFRGGEKNFPRRLRPPAVP